MLKISTATSDVLTAMHIHDLSELSLKAAIELDHYRKGRGRGCTVMRLTTQWLKDVMDQYEQLGVGATASDLLLLWRVMVAMHLFDAREPGIPVLTREIAKLLEELQAATDALEKGATVADTVMEKMMDFYLALHGKACVSGERNHYSHRRMALA